MVIILYLLAICIFFIILVLGFIFSTLKINIKDLIIQKDENNKIYNCYIKVGIYFFGILKLISIKVFNNRIEFLGKKIYISNIKSLKIINTIYKINNNGKIKLKELKNLKIQVLKLDFKLDIGFDNVLVTSFLVFFISTVLSFVIKDNSKKYNPKKYKYIIKPHYRCSNNINLKVNSIIKIKTVHIINVLLNYKKRSVMKNERTSYRRSYEDSHEQYPGYGRC